MNRPIAHSSMPELDDLRRDIIELASRYGELAFKPKPFQPGISPVPVSG